MGDSGREIVVARDPEDLSLRAAQFVIEYLAQRSGSTGRVSIALAGGSTPIGLYARLASDDLRNRIPWPRVHLFWGDERCVPPDDPKSNYRAAQDALIPRLSLPPENIHRMRGEDPRPEQAALDYENELRAFFQAVPQGATLFDLVLLGIGEDGHTASLFPGSPALDETRRWTAAPFVKQLNAHRLTLTLPLLNRSACVLFMASGAGKSSALKSLRGEEVRHPFQRIRPSGGRLIFYMDRAAAAHLEPNGG